MKFRNLYESLFYKTLRIRLVEERIIELYPSDKIQSPVHLSIGQEAIAVGACESLRDTDLLFSSYRGHAFYLAKGGDLRHMFAELYGKVTGCCKGKGGSMHLAASEVGLMGSSAVVASTIPHAVGSALAAKRLKLDQVNMAVFGDGATEEGVYHEAINLAALWRLPVVFLCENNGLAVHSELAKRQSFRMVEHARTYGIEATSCIAGQDFIQVHELVSRIVEEIRRAPHPHFVEIQTYRYKEHVGPGEDYDAGFRQRKELESWRAKDPVIINTALVKKYRPIIEAEIDEAIDFAESSPYPNEQQLLFDIV